MTTLSREQLDGMGCATPNCTHDHSMFYLHSRCHTATGVHVTYYKATGTLKIICARCERPVAEIAVAQRV